MKKSENRKKGVTLAELCVVMAITAVVSTTVVSFCMLINAHIGRIAQTNETQADFNMIENAIERFVTGTDSERYEIYVRADGALGAKEVKSGTEYELRYDESGAVKGASERGEFSYPLSYVKGLEFRIRSSESGEKMMIVCRVIYTKTASATGMQIERDTEIYKAVRSVRGGAAK